jgi:hypothetical protein
MSTIAVFGVLAGGSAYAASKIGPSDIKKNAVRSKHIKDGAITAKDIQSETREQLRGPAGPAGAPATALWAAVDASGNLMRGSHATGSVLGPTGNYTVTFDRDVSACVSTASISNNVGQINAVNALGGPQNVYIGVSNSAGGPANQPFYLAVFC